MPSMAEGQIVEEVELPTQAVARPRLVQSGGLERRLSPDDLEILQEFDRQEAAIKAGRDTVMDLYRRRYRIQENDLLLKDGRILTIDQAIEAGIIAPAEMTQQVDGSR